MILDQIVATAIEGEYFTADGERVMLPLKALVELGLVEAAAIDQLKRRLDLWHTDNPTEETCHST